MPADRKRRWRGTAARSHRKALGRIDALVRGALKGAWLARQLVVAVRRTADLPAFTQRLVKHLSADVVAEVLLKVAAEGAAKVVTPKALRPATAPAARLPGVKRVKMKK